MQPCCARQNGKMVFSLQRIGAIYRFVQRAVNITEFLIVAAACRAA